MTELTDLLWQKAEAVLYLTKDQFVQSLAEWTIKPIYSGGELAWITVQKGPEFHFQSIGKTRYLSMRTIRSWLQPIIDVHGYAQTKTPIEDVRQQRINKLVGFYEASRDSLDIHFRIENFPMRKDGHSCQ